MKVDEIKKIGIMPSSYAEDRKNKIEETAKQLLTSKAQYTIVPVGEGRVRSSYDKIYYTSEKMYELYKLGALVPPQYYYRGTLDDQYNNGPYNFIAEFSEFEKELINIPKPFVPSPENKNSIPEGHYESKLKEQFKKYNRIQKIATSKDEKYDIPGVVTIKIYPKYLREALIKDGLSLEEGIDLKKEYGDSFSFTADPIDEIKLEMTPKQLAEART